MKLGLISDIHEDISTLERAIRELEKADADEIVCLGDIVGYSIPFYNYMSERSANAVVDLVRTTCSTTVMGNHDLYAVKQIPNHRSFFNYPESWYQQDFEDRKNLASGKIHLYEDNELPTLLSSKNREFIRHLPEYVIRELDGHSVLFSHYALPDCTGSSTWSPKDPRELTEHFKFMRDNGCVYSFSGNDHVEGAEIFTTDQKLSISFETVALPDDLVWAHGPAIARGTTHNGCMLYDASNRELTAIPLKSDLHIVPRFI